jgi:hypothetical protein
MKRTFLTLAIAALAAILLPTSGNAQVTIGFDGDPNGNALLDLKENVGGTATKGLLLPRVALTSANLATPMSAHVAGMVVYNTGTSLPAVSGENYVSPGYYYNTGSRWERLHSGGANWFYMPSITIDVSIDGTFTRNLYLEYRKQFADDSDSQIAAGDYSPTPGKALVKSDANAPNPLTKIYEANELYYYVTGYDGTVFSALSISAAGLLTYTVNANNVSEATYLNIVFVVK